MKGHTSPLPETLYLTFYSSSDTTLWPVLQEPLLSLSLFCEDPFLWLHFKCWCSPGVSSFYLLALDDLIHISFNCHLSLVDSKPQISGLYTHIHPPMGPSNSTEPKMNSSSSPSSSASEQSIHLTIKHSLCQALRRRHRMSYFHSRTVNNHPNQLAAQGGDLRRIPSSLFPTLTSALGIPCHEFHSLSSPFPWTLFRASYLLASIAGRTSLLVFLCLVWPSLLMPGHF